MGSEMCIRDRPWARSLMTSLAQSAPFPSLGRGDNFLPEVREDGFSVLQEQPRDPLGGYYK